MANEVNPRTEASLNELLRKLSNEQWNTYQNIIKDIPEIAMGDRDVEMEMKLDAAQCVIEGIRG